MAIHPRDPLAGTVAGGLSAALAAVLYGSAYVAIAIALDGFTPIGVALWRGLLGALALGLVLSLPHLADHRPHRLGRPALARLGVLGLTGGGIFVLAMNVAVALSGATITAFVAGLYAVAAALLAIPLLGEPLERRTVVAMLAALAGTALLSDVVSGGGQPVGIAMALTAATSFGLFLVLSRRWSASYGLSGPVVGVASLAISALVALCLALVSGDRVAVGQPGASAVLAVGWVALGPGALASVLVVIGMRRLRAQTASLLLLLNPPTAALLAIVLLGERLGPVQVAGAALILGAIGSASGIRPRRTAFRCSSPQDSEPPRDS
jgi:DME family drug/metabolite transporter